MVPNRDFCIHRMDDCVADLCANGINLREIDERGLARVVSEHLDYFQLMLGFDSDPAEVLDLLMERSRSDGPQC